MTIECMKRDNMFSRDALHPTHHRTCRLVLRCTFAPTDSKKGNRQPDFVYVEVALLFNPLVTKHRELQADERYACCRPPTASDAPVTPSSFLCTSSASGQVRSLPARAALAV